MDAGELYRRVDSYMRRKYRVSLDDLEPTNTPGYWRDKEPRMDPLSSKPFRFTYTYYDHQRGIKGRFDSRTKTWAELKLAHEHITPRRG